MPVSLTIGADDDGRRLDRVLRKHLSALPLSAIHRLLRMGGALVDGRKASASDRLRTGSVLTLPDSAAAATGDRKAGGSASAILPPLDIVWEDKDILVVSKDAGILVHGEASLEEAVLARLSGTLEPSLSFKPGPLHRLDRGTSGLVAFSVSIRGARIFSEALRSRLIRKRYLAILEGSIGDAEEWEDQLERDKAARITRVVAGADAADGSAATTKVLPLARSPAFSLAIVEIGTGRTHQIRSQAASRGHPLSGDVKYGGRYADGGFFLHAYELAVPEGAGLTLPSRLIAIPPPRFLRRTSELFGAEMARGLAERLPTDTLRPTRHV